MTDQVRFLQCLPFVLHEEVLEPPGGWSHFVWSDISHNFSNDRHDPGGATMCGIIQREYDHYRKTHGLPVRPVQFLSEDEGHWIYYNWYWLPHSPLLLPGLDLSFFDSSVNEGSTEAIRILQHVMGLEADGQWGPKTAAAVAAIPPGTAAATIRAFAERRKAVYHESRGFGYFGKDWLARTARIETASLGAIDDRRLPDSGGATTASTASEGSEGAAG